MSAELDTSVVETGWLPLMRQWLVDAVEADAPEPNAMTLSTVDDGGRPASRTVLCKGLSADGVLFFTNYGSDKGRHLDAAPVRVGHLHVADPCQAGHRPRHHRARECST